MARLEAGSDDWLGQFVEDVIDPDRVINDPHHHLWDHADWRPYKLDDLWADTGSGHLIRNTVFIECHSHYHSSGDKDFRSLGETEFAAAVAAESRSHNNQRANIAGIVARADLRLPNLDAILDAHESAADGLLRGIRHPAARDELGDFLHIPGRSQAGLYANTAFRRGLRTLAQRGLCFDAWHYHHQNGEFLAAACAVPEATMVLNHFGTPLGVGPYASQRDSIFSRWRDDITALARCPNVYAKLGGLAMPDNGFGWHIRDRPASSDELVSAQARFYLHTIECFGPQRCMFESNFPVDRLSISYRSLWNAFKKLTASFSASEKDALFRGTAASVYTLP